MSSTWDKVAELVEKLDPKNLPDELAKFGPYRYVYYTQDYYDEVDIGYYLPSGSCVQVGFRWTGHWSPRHLTLITASEIRSLRGSQITDEDFAPVEQYPHFKCEWTRDKLTLFRVDVAGDAFMYFEPQNKETHRKGDDKQLADIPVTLTNQDQILGRPVLHEINHEEQAQKILDASELEQFVNEVLKARATLA